MQTSPSNPNPLLFAWSPEQGRARLVTPIENGLYRVVVSPVHYREVGAIREISERLEMESLLRRLDESCECDLTQIRHRAEALIDMGFGITDAVHLAFAEELAEFFITCDDKLLKRCRQAALRITALSPLEFIAREET